MIPATASPRIALPALRGWPLFVTLSLLFHLLLLLLIHLFAPERLKVTDTIAEPIDVQLQAGPQPVKTANPVAPATPHRVPAVAKSNPAPAAPAPVTPPAVKESAQPAQGQPAPLPRPFDRRELGTSQRLLDEYPGAEGPPPTPPEESQPNGDIRSSIELQIRTRFEEHFVYPQMAQIHGWQGEVLLSFRIDIDGTVSHIQVISSSGYPILDQAALDSMSAIQHIEFNPGAELHNMIELRMPVIYRLAQR